MIPFQAGDRAEQRPAPDNARVWESPSIWLNGGTTRTTAVEGADTTATVVVQNDARVPLERIHVEVFPCQLGVNQMPAGMLLPSPLRGFDTEPLPPGQQREITTAGIWRPTARQLQDSGGHVCLGVNCWADRPIEGRELLPGDEILPYCVSNHAQRNIAIIAAPPGTRVEQAMPLWGLASGLEQTDDFGVLVEVRPIPTEPEVELGPGNLELLEASAFGGRDTAITQSLNREPTQPELIVVGAGRGQNVAVQVNPLTPRRAIWSVDVHPDEVPGTVQVYEAISRLASTEEVVSGATIMVLAQ